MTIWTAYASRIALKAIKKRHWVHAEETSFYTEKHLQLARLVFQGTMGELKDWTVLG